MTSSRPPVAVHVDGLSKSFGPVSALAPLRLDIQRGEVLGLLGPNGAGKTTLIRLLLGLLRPSAGRAEIFGLDATAAAAHVHRRLAYVPGEAALWPSLTGRQTLRLLGRLHGDVDESYREELIEAFELDPAVRVRAYSKGNRQKVVLIAALMTRAELLLLDEPTSGLDPLMERVFREQVKAARERGQTILLSSHILSEVEALGDRVAILRSGRLIDLGTMEELRHLSALEVEVTFDGPLPDLAGTPGVSDIRRVGQTLTLSLRSDANALIATLAGQQVSRLLIREPSLEELFLSHYGAAREEPSRDAG